MAVNNAFLTRDATTTKADKGLDGDEPECACAKPPGENVATFHHLRRPPDDAVPFWSLTNIIHVLGKIHEKIFFDRTL